MDVAILSTVVAFLLELLMLCWA